MGALATILASIITSVMTIFAALAALVLFGGRRAAVALSGAVARLPAADPAAPAPASGPSPLSALNAGPSTHFSVHKARLEFLDSPARVGRPCRVRFEWILYNGAHSYITYRSRVRAEGQQEATPHEVSDPPATSPRGTSYQQRISGGLDAEFTWNAPGIYQVRARVKASIEGTPFTYQFEIKRRVRVVAAKVVPPPEPQPEPAPDQLVL